MLISASAWAISAPSRTFTEIVPTERSFAWLPPSMRLRAVEIGMRITSSWSWPQDVCPLLPRMPTTLNSRMIPTRMVEAFLGMRKEVLEIQNQWSDPLAAGR